MRGSWSCYRTAALLVALATTLGLLAPAPSFAPAHASWSEPTLALLAGAIDVPGGAVASSVRDADPHAPAVCARAASAPEPAPPRPRHSYAPVVRAASRFVPHPAPRPPPAA